MAFECLRDEGGQPMNEDGLVFTSQGFASKAARRLDSKRDLCVEVCRIVNRLVNEILAFTSHCRLRS